ESADVSGVPVTPVSELISLFNNEKYSRILNARIDHNDQRAKYTLALAFYRRFQQQKKNEKDAGKYLLHSVQILREIRESKRGSAHIRAKAGLWFAMLCVRYLYDHTDFNELRDTLVSLKKPAGNIYYNDAVFYLALLYRKNKDYYKMKNCYYYLSTFRGKDPVYDIFKNRSVSAATAAAAYLKGSSPELHTGELASQVKKIHNEISTERRREDSDIFIDKKVSEYKN
ncbi:MAG TPA: hypothetical protein VKS21_03660, partial [Spirochaetota bacterium]|nr:hypothetical protein [Spirochaetota bacterium]